MVILLRVWVVETYRFYLLTQSRLHVQRQRMLLVVAVVADRSIELADLGSFILSKKALPLTSCSLKAPFICPRELL